MSDGRVMDYRLAESVITISGTVARETDRYSVAAGTPAETVNWDKSETTVSVGVRGDLDPQAVRHIELGNEMADGTYEVALTGDGRLTAVSLNTTGAGARVVSAAATVLAFVGGLAATVVGAGARAAVPGRALTITGSEEAGDGKRRAPKPETADARALAAWTAAHGTLAEHRTRYQDLRTSAEDRLLEAREAVTTAASATESRDALARVRRIETVLDDVAAEIERVDTLYRAWRAGTIATRTESLSYALSVRDLGEWEAGRPQPDRLDADLKAIWDTLGVIVRVEPLTQHEEHKEPPADPPANPPMAADRGDRPDPSLTVAWRSPRPVRVWVWRRAKGGGVVLERVTSTLVVDGRDGEASLPIEQKWFGESGVTIAFDELGAPSKVTATMKGSVGAFADALKAAPEAVTSGLGSAKTAEATWSGLRDARELHRLDALKRRKEELELQLAAKGLEATVEDIARLKRLEQQVAIAAAEDTLAAPSDLDLLKLELELAKTRAALKAVQAGGGGGGGDDQPSLVEEVADLQRRVTALGG
jgi:hypothetical protein